MWASRRVNNEADFLLGGRRLGPWVAGLSYAASTSSAWVLLGFSGFLFNNGLSALWMLPGVWGGYIAVWLWLGPKLRQEASDRNWITPTEFLCANVEGGARQRIVVLISLMVVLCFVFYIAAQFDAAAAAFVSSFDMGKSSSLMLGAAIILFYCLLGGFWAASVTDTLQAIVMLAAAILVPTVAVWHAGGPGGISATLLAGDNAAFLDWTGGMPTYVLIGFILGVWGVGIGALGQPQLIARLMAVRGDKERRQGFAIAMTWAVVIFLGMSVLALAARALAVAPGNSEHIFYLMAERFLPPVLAGIVIAAILSAVMSTVDSLLIAASAAVSHDMGIAKRSKLGALTVTRLVMTGIVICAVLLALLLPDTIFNRVLFAWSALGAAFGPVLVMRVMGHEPAGNARFWSIATGFGLTVLFYTLGTMPADAGNGPLEALIGLAHWPGDPFERVFPWLPALLILHYWPNRVAHP